MKFCQECGKQLDDNAKFCTRCGYAAEPGQENPYIAKNEPIQENPSVEKNEPTQENPASGVNAQANNNPSPADILGKRMKIYGIITIVTAALNILSIVFLFLGLYDLYWGFKWLEIGKKIPKLTEKEIVKVAESYSRTSTIILFFIFNLIFLGPIGGMVASIYYCVAIKSFIDKNKSYFESLEQAEKQ